ncbi:hypothetical protein IW261DRAFT_1459177, partial [Armillaria novae-zelandiae]
MWGCLYLIFNCTLSFLLLMYSAHGRLKTPSEVSVSINGTQAVADSSLCSRVNDNPVRQMKVTRVLGSTYLSL